MYLGAALALSGAALFYRSTALLMYAGLFLVATHLFVIGYEEPALRRTFSEDSTGTGVTPVPVESPSAT